MAVNPIMVLNFNNFSLCLAVEIDGDFINKTTTIAKGISTPITNRIR
jgi:hypothetical protein